MPRFRTVLNRHVSALPREIVASCRLTLLRAKYAREWRFDDEIGRSIYENRTRREWRDPMTVKRYAIRSLYIDFGTT